MRNSVVCSLDIGSTKVIATISKYNSQKLLVMLGIGGVKSDGIKGGRIINIKKLTKSIQIAIDIAEGQSGLKIKNAYVNITGQHICNKDIRINEKINFKKISNRDIIILQDRAKSFLNLSNDSIIHSNIKQTYLDNELFNNTIIDQTCSELGIVFNFVVGNEILMNDLKDCIENNCNVKVRKFVLNAVSSSNSILSTMDKENGIILLDFGGGTTDLAVFYKNKLHYYAVAPFGGDSITHDISLNFNITHKDAQKLKFDFGSAIIMNENCRDKIIINKNSENESGKISHHELTEVINARLNEIITIIQHHITKADLPQIKKIVITGSSVHLKDLTQYLQFKLNYDIRVENPNLKLLNTSNILDFENSTRYSTSIGLLLEDKKEESNNNTKESFSFSSIFSSKEKKIKPKIVKDESKTIKKVGNLFASFFNEDERSM